MKALAVLIVYCLLFSILFVVLYPLYYEEKTPVPWEGKPDAAGEGRGGKAERNKAAHVVNAVEQRQVLGLYDDSQSQESPSTRSPKWVPLYP